MTGKTRWIVCNLLLACPLVSAGCAMNSRVDRPALAGEAVLAGDRIEGESQTAAALQQLESSSSAATDAVKAISLAREVSVNNIANAETQAYKGSRAIIQGEGKVSIQLDLMQGSLQNTGGNLDVGIKGAGFFAVKALDSSGGTVYTRAGNFTVNNVGQLVVNSGDGYELVPPIQLPTNATNVTIGTDGTVQYVKAGQTFKTSAGQIKLAMFPNPGGLNLLGGGIYTQTEASGPAVTSVPGLDGTGQVISGFLESSNVDVIKETVRLHQLDEWRAALLQAMGVHIPPGS